MVFPTHLEIGWTLIVGGLLTSALVELNQRWPGPLELVAGQIRRGRLLSHADAFLPLRDAARELYEANINGWIGEAARQDPGGGADPLLWCAYHLAPYLGEIYGRRPPSTMLERIPSTLLTYAHLRDHGDSLTGGDGGDYVDLCVKRDTFQALLPALSEMPRNEPG